MKILVTGAAGFIGYSLTRKLLELGNEVIGLDNINNYYDVDLKYGRLKDIGIRQQEIRENYMSVSTNHPKYRFVKLDIQDRIRLDTLFESENFDVVCNLAAQAGVRYSLENPHAYLQSNINGFLNILECCRHYEVTNLCYASSSSVYGLNKSQPFKTTDSVAHPVSIYAATKKANELMAHTYSHLYGIRTTGLRFFTVYGPWGRPDMAPMLFTEAIINDKSIKVFNHGDMSRDFTYIDDIVDGIIKVINNPAIPDEGWNALEPDPSSSSAPYKIYNIGSNNPVKLMDFIRGLEDEIGKVANKDFMEMQSGDVKSTYADVESLIKDMNYRPSTPMTDGIKAFVKWYKDFYNIREQK